MSTPTLRRDEFATVATPKLPFAVTTRRISRPVAHTIESLSMVWQKPRPVGETARPRRLAALTLCGEWLASVRLQESQDPEPACQVCEAAYLRWRVQHGLPRTSGQADF